MTKAKAAKLAKINAAYAELEAARVVFDAAISKFQKVYNPETVGLDYWQEGLMDTMGEIQDDINEQFEEAE
jgi:rhamnose utilization protein RhaD (predicted bifunctional aldolase and dehydrogenase)